MRVVKCASVTGCPLLLILLSFQPFSRQSLLPLNLPTTRCNGAGASVAHTSTSAFPAPIRCSNSVEGKVEPAVSVRDYVSPPHHRTTCIRRVSFGFTAACVAAIRANENFSAQSPPPWMALSSRLHYVPPCPSTTTIST
ncbi:hypothetical protein R3P38DRAFT_3106329 [Favolaschia claudopus]|uniref:Secreted protein n=1 Tax=Favolaschia claudopus TaxID=2862362 RepID=A0AAV9ZIL6_9AGAR